MAQKHTPTAAAIRAARALRRQNWLKDCSPPEDEANLEHIAAIIDRETGLAELLTNLKWAKKHLDPRGSHRIDIIAAIEKAEKGDE